MEVIRQNIRVNLKYVFNFSIQKNNINTTRMSRTYGNSFLKLKRKPGATKRTPCQHIKDNQWLQSVFCFIVRGLLKIGMGEVLTRSNFTEAPPGRGHYHCDMVTVSNEAIDAICP